MKKIQLFAFAIAFFSFFSLLAQPENDPCSAPCLSTGGTTSGTNPPADGTSPNVNLPCGSQTSEDNPTWYTFVAGQTNFILNVSTSGCASGSSIQATIYEGDDCGSVSAIGCINCVTTGTVNAVTIPGRQYWIQVDGCAEAVCNFTLTYDPNSILKSIPTPPTILGATNTCLGSILKYEAKLLDGIIPSWYKWEITPTSAGKIINQDTTTVTIEWTSAGTFQLCATPKFNVKCPVTVKKGCMTVTVNPTSWNPAECKINLCETQLPYTVSLADCIKTTNPNFNETPNPATFLISQQSSGAATNQVSYTTAQGQCGSTVKLISTVSVQLNPSNDNTAAYVSIPKIVALKPIVLKANPTFKGTVTPSTITILEKKTGIYLKKIKYKADNSSCEGLILLKVWVIKKGGMLQENPVSSKISNDSENDLEIETAFIPSDDMDFAVYPNPSNGTFQLDFAKEKEDFQVRVFDANGRLIVEDKNNKTIDLQAFSKGIYWLKISDGDWSEVVKLIKI